MSIVTASIEFRAQTSCVLRQLGFGESQIGRGLAGLFAGVLVPDELDEDATDIFPEGEEPAEPEEPYEPSEDDLAEMAVMFEEIDRRRSVIVATRVDRPYDDEPRHLAGAWD